MTTTILIALSIYATGAGMSWLAYSKSRCGENPVMRPSRKGIALGTLAWFLIPSLWMHKLNGYIVPSKKFRPWLRCWLFKKMSKRAYNIWGIVLGIAMLLTFALLLYVMTHQF